MRSLLLTLCLAMASAALAEDSPLAEEARRSVSDYVTRGEEQFRKNEIAGSVRDFQRAVALAPQIEPRLWQLGISHYYAGNYRLGQQLFELHQQVNQNDVENAAWHFLCAARFEGVEPARKQLLEIDVARDVRVPMREVYQFYAGQGTAAAVLAAAEQADTERARMYAHLYLGLYYEVAGKVDRARSHMQKAAAARLAKNYMHDVAKIHLLQREWNP